jgi:hypothetical protein
MGTKISIVENLVLIMSLVMLLWIRFSRCCKSSMPAFASSHRCSNLRLGLNDWISVNDPSAGSPTETLLRLLLPLSDMVYSIFHSKHETPSGPKDSPDHSKSVGATGGVYKGQGLNQRRLLTCAY